MKNKPLMLIGLWGIVVLIALMISVRDILPGIAIKVLLVLLALAVLALAYLLYWLYGRFHKQWHENKIRAHELRAQEQALRIESEQHEMNMFTMKAHAHVLLSRVPLDPNGNAPILIRPELFTLPRQEDVLLLPAGQLRGVKAREQETNLLGNPEAYLPAPYKLSEVLQRFTPTKDGIFLAKGNDLITVPIGEPLCHTTFTGNTDAGKTNDERTLLIQLLFLEQIVYLCDRNYQRFRVDKKQAGVVYDYSSIEDRLAYTPAVTTPEAVRVLEYLVDELEDRRTRRRKTLVNFPDIYLFMDEMPAFCAEDRKIMEYVGRLVRESRQYGIFFIGAAQDLLNDTMQAKAGAYRDNFLTNYYGGGDATTARMVLNLQKGEVIDETGLGYQGVKYLRAKGAGIEHDRIRTAYADNPATSMLLGRSNYVQSTIVTQEDEEMEELQPRNSYQSFRSEPTTPYERGYRPDSDFQTGPLQRDFEREKETDGAVSVFAKNASNRPVDGSDFKTEEGPKYRFSETEIVQFIAAYKMVGNIEKVLSSMHKGSGYKQHARELIQVHSLRQNA